MYEQKRRVLGVCQHSTLHTRHALTHTHVIGLLAIFAATIIISL